MSEPRERPILFSGAMVRALLDGQKTQTRRVVKIAGIEKAVSGHFYPSVGLAVFGRADKGESKPVPCPFGTPGDRLFGTPGARLWVRETWALEDCDEDGERVIWQADREAAWREALDERFYLASDYQPAHWKPSIHMPRWACRLLLEVTAVRVQRLQDITEEDAWAEGALAARLRSTRTTTADLPSARTQFRLLWESISVRDSSWDANPWVWAVSFRRVEGSR